MRAIACSEAGAHKGQCSLHAEVAMLKRLRGVKVQRWTVVSLRVDTNGHLHEAMPCKDCTRKLHRAGFRRVVYSSEGSLKKISMKELMNTCSYSSGMRRRGVK